MKRFEVRKYGNIEGLLQTEVPEPEVGPRQMLVRMKAVSLNYRDLAVVRGAYGKVCRPGLVPVSDGAGEIVKVGAEVKSWRVGDRVMGTFSQTWVSGPMTRAAVNGALGGAIDGVLSEYVVFEEHGAVHMPSHLSFEEASTLPCAAVTAWSALVTRGQLVAGQTVLVLGTGGVSVFAIQFAKQMGARVIVTSSSDAKLEKAKAYGADDGINYKKTPKWEEVVFGLTRKEGVDLVVEVSGAGTLTQSLRATRMGGRVAVIGVLSSGQGSVDLVPLFTRGIDMFGIYVGPRDAFVAMNRAVELHKLQPIVDRIFEFDEAQEAYRYLESGGHFGKVVIRVGQ